jgi:hypothetical protein
MPSEAELPRGPHRDFTEQLFSLYRQAHRPALRTISRAVPQDAPATASVETIRRILRGISVPAHWDTVNAVLNALCELAGVDPDMDLGGQYDDLVTRRGLVEDAWHEALDNPRGKARAVPADDPWASDARGDATYSDEPPF